MESENTAVDVAKKLAKACRGSYGCPLFERGPKDACPISAMCDDVTEENWLEIFRQASHS